MKFSNPLAFVGRLFAAEPNPRGGPTDDFWYTPVGTPSSTGLRISPGIAMQVSAVFACVKVLAETMGTLPLIVYERIDDRSKQRAYTTPEYRLLNTEPNSWQTPYDFKENMTAWAALHGDAFAYKIFGINGVIEELDPIHPGLVRVEKLPTRRLRYWVRQSDGTEKAFVQGEIFHLRGFSLDGLTGVQLSKQAREAIGLARAMEAFASRYFANDTTVGTVLEHPNKLSPEAHKRLSESFITGFGGVMNAFRPKVLEEGMKLSRMDAKAKDAQLTEARQHQVIEICRYYRMQPHKIAHLMQATFSNIEHQAIEHVTDTITPWAVRWEEAVTRDIILDDTKYFAEFLLAALMRGDAKTRAEYYQTRIQNGTISRNEIRALENENPIEGGDVYYMNAAVVPLDAQGRPIPQEKVTARLDTPPPPDEPGTGNPDTEDVAAHARTSFQSLLDDAAERIAYAEGQQLSKRAEHAAADPDRFIRWAIDEVYVGHLAYAERTLAPIVAAWRALAGGSIEASTLASAIIADGTTRLSSPAFRADPSAVIASRRADIAAVITNAFPSLEPLAHAA